MITLAYKSDKPDPADVVVVDNSATTHGATITTRRFVWHEAIVKAWRPVFLANLEEAARG